MRAREDDSWLASLPDGNGSRTRAGPGPRWIRTRLLSQVASDSPRDNDRVAEAREEVAGAAGAQVEGLPAASQGLAAAASSERIPNPAGRLRFTGEDRVRFAWRRLRASSLGGLAHPRNPGRWIALAAGLLRQTGKVPGLGWRRGQPVRTDFAGPEIPISTPPGLRGVAPKTGVPRQAEFPPGRWERPGTRSRETATGCPRPARTQWR